jgi:hypothetical protein
MHPDPGSRSRLRYSARVLPRAAGAVQTHATAPAEMPPTPGTLAHVEEALDRLGTGLMMMAGSLGEDDAAAASDGDAEALRWHLAETARRIQAATESCRASREWSRRVAGPEELTTTR